MQFNVMPRAQLFLKEYNRPYLKHKIVGQLVISRVMVKIIEELSNEIFAVFFKRVMHITLTIASCCKLDSFSIKPLDMKVPLYC